MCVWRVIFASGFRSRVLFTNQSCANRRFESCQPPSLSCNTSFLFLGWLQWSPVRSRAIVIILCISSRRLLLWHRTWKHSAEAGLTHTPRPTGHCHGIEQRLEHLLDLAYPNTRQHDPTIINSNSQNRTTLPTSNQEKIRPDFLPSSPQTLPPRRHNAPPPS